MTTFTQPQARISIEDYLEGERTTEIKHEYLGGQVAAMGGASDKHGLIGLSLAALLHPLARRKGCQLFMGDMKVRVDHDGESDFYYPDLLLTRQPDDRESPNYRRNPCLLSEILAPSTERIDRVEKLLAYRLLPSLREYLLLRQDCVQADLYQLGDDGRWRHKVFSQPDEVLALRCLDVGVSLRDVYADVPELLGPVG
ncbi:MAG TPA: Uma2 family endonuclease [Alicycliphilus sp.]|nr:Uma2 family endonuclease [Alicycliphilus sp.]